ncbi:MAG: hypothetical protein JWN74_3234 [Acidobacteriaceae bacterium]|nr:hypothetical protein [Acidobacteriaceae bacterium]
MGHAVVLARQGQQGLGYDDTNLYVVMACWDDKHVGVRASLTRREPSTPFDSDDYIEFTGFHVSVDVRQLSR